MIDTASVAASSTAPGAAPPAGRIAAAFARLRSAGRRALIPYVTAGFPFPDVTPALMHGMVRAGADVIELGVPFSDPMADGPVIQQAGERALAHGVGTAQVLAMVREFRRGDAATPVVLMGYANPVERYDGIHGAGAFIRDASAAGVDGVLVVDYPPEECEQFAADLRAAGMDLIFLLAPTSTDARMAQVARLASGYVYYVSLKGVTGAGHLDTGAVGAMLPRIREHVRIPVGVGFGIRDAQTATAVGAVADAVVIGTRLIQLIEHQPDADAAVAAAHDFLHGIRAALDTLPRPPAAPDAAPTGETA
ncbi:MAG: tryptophan synthase subunit alpha [Xylophilus ampelinus]